jgi:hypothetical protein
MGFSLKTTGRPISDSQGSPTDEVAYSTVALPLPPDLWLHGWIHMLTDAELLLYLALCHHVATHPVMGGGHFVLDRQARDVYGVSKENYESLRELETFGLIRLIVDDDRSRLNGRMRNFRAVGRGKFHRVTLVDEALSTDAGPAVLSGLRSLASRPRTPEATASPKVSPP